MGLVQIYVQSEDIKTILKIHSRHKNYTYNSGDTCTWWFKLAT